MEKGGCFLLKAFSFPQFLLSQIRLQACSDPVGSKGKGLSMTILEAVVCGVGEGWGDGGGGIKVWKSISPRSVRKC